MAAFTTSAVYLLISNFILSLAMLFNIDAKFSGYKIFACPVITLDFQK